MYGDRLIDRSLSAQTGNMVLLLLNAVGAVVYVYRASPSWANPVERQAGIYTLTGEPFVWFAGILPVLILFFVVNLAWMALIITRPQWRSKRTLLLTAVCWLAAVWIDFAHH
jgi:uncharacterized membrane protein YoaK (UPF0700 family)